MALRVETVMMGPETAQYAGQGQAATGVARIAAQARALEDLGFDGMWARPPDWPNNASPRSTT